jgi:hypothetical protein
MTVGFAPGTPQSVCELVGEWLALPDLKPIERAAIERIGSYPAMTGFWRDKLPAASAGMEADVIWQTRVAFMAARNLKPPIPGTKAGFAEYIAHHRLVELTYGMIASQARWLRENLQEIPSTTRHRWPELSAHSNTFDQITTIIDDITVVCDRLDIDGQEAAAAINLPAAPRRRGAIKAQRTYFGRIMSDYFTRTFGGPCDQAVTILEDVVFDLAGEIEGGTARSRRRGVKPRWS